MNIISFPGLGIGPMTIYNSVKIFGFSIHWYGIIIATGIILAYLFAVREGKKRGVTQDTLIDVILCGLPSAIVCARIYYVAFEWEQYRNNLWDVFKIWEGGIAIYGGVIGAVLATWIYCRVKKISFANVADLGGFGFPIGQAIGRWGNFVNAEAYGEATTLPWRMEIAHLGYGVHPTFLYESLWNVGAFLFLLWYHKKQKFEGEIFLMYLTAYGLGRFWIEGLRTDSLWIGPMRVSQLVALLCFVVGGALIIYFRKKKKKETHTL